MSGEKDPQASVSASIYLLSKRDDIHLHLIGNQERIEHFLPNKINDKITIHHTDEVITMKDSPMDVLRRKKNSSMRLAVEMVANNQADACVSSGNTGALLAISKYLLKTIPTISRPALVKSIPTIKSFTYMLDLGANADCTPEQLLQFGIMGSILTNVLHKKNNPSIGLLSNGSESMKGSEVVKKSAELFRNSHLNFHGNVEGDDIFKGTTDVVVCDGFTGNISLKTTEGLAQMMANFLTLEFKRNLLTKISALIALPVLKRFKKRLDPRRYNGASFLGLNGVVVKSHGGADEFAFIHALETTISESENDVISKIKDQLKVESII